MGTVFVGFGPRLPVTVGGNPDRGIEMSEDQIDEIVSTTAATIEAEVEKMISLLPDGFDTSDAVTRLAEFLNHDKPFGALIGRWRVAHLTIELLEAESR
jgi:hypothetical protein